jgi:hypothetical protein
MIDMDSTPITINSSDRDTLQKLFKRAKSLEITTINLSDRLERDKFLQEYREQEHKRKVVEALVKGFDPDVQVIVPKEQLDISNQIKALVGMASTLQDIKNVQGDIATKVTEVHAVQTGKLYKPKKTLSNKERKEKEEAEFQEERRQIHLSWLNK